MQGSRIDRGIDAARSQKRLRCGCEANAVFILTVIKRLDAKAVARQENFPGLTVPDGEGEGAVKMGGAIVAPFDIGAQDDFGIAIGMESVALGDQFGADLRIVVDGAVEHQRKAGGIIQHGLARAIRQVNDRQAAMAQGDTTVEI